jgi:hypothetical protein
MHDAVCRLPRINLPKLSEKGRRGLKCSLTIYPKALFVLRTPAKFTLGALLKLPFRTASLEDVSLLKK